jgi:hypothetical protein
MGSFFEDDAHHLGHAARTVQLQRQPFERPDASDTALVAQRLLQRNPVARTRSIAHEARALQKTER